MRRERKPRWSRVRTVVEGMHRSIVMPFQHRERSRICRWRWSSRAELAARQHLEDLVSIAVASAQQADDALQRACQASTRAKRGIWGCTSIGAILVLVGIAGIPNHSPYYGSDRELAAKAGDGLSVAEPQRHASGQLSEIEDQALAPPPVGPVGRLSSTAPILDPAVEEASAPDSNVSRSSSAQLDERLGTGTAPAASQVLHATNAPMGTTAPAYPTQPYGLNASTSVPPLDSTWANL